MDNFIIRYKNNEFNRYQKEKLGKTPSLLHLSDQSYLLRLSDFLFNFLYAFSNQTDQSLQESFPKQTIQ